MSIDADRPGMTREGAFTAVATLADELRRRMFDFVSRARRPVTREEVAAEVGISRKLAAFHLDKLVTVGLLRTEFASADDRRKVGRSPRTYQPAQTDIRLAIPDRRHELLAGILLDAAVDARPRESSERAIQRVARTRGEAAGAADRDQLRPGRLGVERALTVSQALLERHGYQPDRVSPTRLCLRNCPFDPLQEHSPELVCGLNHAYLAGFLDGIQAPTVEAVLAPTAGACCVELRQSEAAAD